MPETLDLTLEPSGCDEFDRARQLLADGRDEEALDWFEVAAGTAAEAPIRASSAAFAAAILLACGRPWEVASWAEVMRVNVPDSDLARLLEASARIQLEDVAGARELLDPLCEPSDPWFPCSATSARVVRAHAAYLDGDVEGATGLILDAFEEDPFAPDVWDAFARFCAETGFDPTLAVATVPEDRVLDLLAALRSSEPSGVDCIVEVLWDRKPGDPRVLALAPQFASRLPSVRALEWSARLRSAGLDKLCPLLARAGDAWTETGERIRAAALAHATFGDEAARDALEAVVSSVPDDDIGAVLEDVWALAPDLADSVVVAGASTSGRSLALVRALCGRGHADEAYAVLVHGLSLDDAELLSADEIVRLLTMPVIEALAIDAQDRGDEEIATICWSVLVGCESPEDAPEGPHVEGPDAGEPTGDPGGASPEA